MPGVPKDSCYGGGGRYLILRIPDAKQRAVFDGSAARIVKYLPLAEADAVYAATRTHLFIAYPGAGVLQRLALGTWAGRAAPGTVEGSDVVKHPTP